MKCNIVSDSFFIPQKVSPSFKEIEFKNHSKECILVEIPQNEYKIIEESAQNMWCSKKNSEYGKGLLNTEEDKFKTERVGRLGDLAFAKIFNLPIDLNYIHNGDECDFYFGFKLDKLISKVDVKTSYKKPNYEKGLIYAINQWGKQIPLKSDIYIFQFIENEDRLKKTAKVCIIGYSTQDYIKNIVPVKSRVSRHYNYEILYKDLKSIKDLL